jgi:hypothetical protein
MQSLLLRQHFFMIRGCQMAFFQTKNPNLGKFLEGLAMEDIGTYILRPFGLFNDHLVYFVAIWYMLWLFGIFFRVLVCCTKKNLATLLAT